MADPINVECSDQSEDQFKTTWDFWRDDGSQIDTIREMSQVLYMGPFQVARMVATYPHPAAVPIQLLREAQGVLRR